MPVLPDYAFGTMFTWYHNYTAAAKLAEIREFASRGEYSSTCLTMGLANVRAGTWQYKGVLEYSPRGA